jgi:hypothetical protein
MLSPPLIESYDKIIVESVIRKFGEVPAHFFCNFGVVKESRIKNE